VIASDLYLPASWGNAIRITESKRALYDYSKTGHVVKGDAYPNRSRIRWPNNDCEFSADCSTKVVLEAVRGQKTVAISWLRD